MAKEDNLGAVCVWWAAQGLAPPSQPADLEKMTLAEPMEPILLTVPEDLDMQPAGRLGSDV